MKRVGKSAPLRHDGYGYCRVCGESWLRTTHHSTDITEMWGCFPMCERCWLSLTPEERLPHYRSLHEEQWHGEGDGSPYSWDDVERAVLAGG